MNIARANRWNWVDFAIVGGVLFALWLIVWRAEQTLHYNWGWEVPLSYIFNETEKGWRAGLLWQGFMISLRLLFWAGIFSLIIGFMVALMALSKLSILRWFATIYVEGLRHLPPIVFIFIFFFFISSQVSDTAAWEWILSILSDNVLFEFLLGDSKSIDNLLKGILCLALFEATFMAEVIRGGILSIPQSQWDGGESLGLPKWQIFIFIIIPQVIRKIAVPLVGQLILLLKNSSLLSIISIQELSFSGQETAVSTQHIFETWLLLAGLYMILCFPLIGLAGYLSKK